MMESVVGTVWPSRHLSRTGWAILNRAREEIQALPLFHGPPCPSWFNSEHRLEASSPVATFLQDLLSDIESATHFYSQAPVADVADRELLAERVVWALLLMQRERLPWTHATCLLCESDEMESNEPRMQDSPRVSMKRRLVSSCGYWTLQDISIFPSLRDLDDQSPLCWTHELEFKLALEAVLGFVEPPVLIFERHHSN